MYNRILIIHPEGNIKNNPNLYNLVKGLTSRGCEVDIFSRQRPEIYQGKLFDKATFLLEPKNNKVYELSLKFHMLQRAYTAVLGIDDGIVEAYRWAQLFRVPYAFISYEILFDSELVKLNDKHFLKKKRASKSACKGILFAVAQDEIRKRFLSDEYGICPDKIMLMPVAGAGTNRIEKNGYFHHKLGIPYEKKILLYMGWLDSPQANRLLAYAEHLPRNWVLVIHSRYKYEYPHPGIPSWLRDKAYFSLTEPIENIEDIDELLGDADAGFCTYKPDYSTPCTGKNVEIIGMSSGKASTFLQHGIPIVIDNMNIWDKIVAREHIGIEIKQPRDLMKLDSLIGDPIKSNCLRFFNAHLDINNFSDPIVSRLLAPDNANKQKINRLYLMKFIFHEIFTSSEVQLPSDRNLVNVYRDGLRAILMQIGLIHIFRKAYHCIRQSRPH